MKKSVNTAESHVYILLKLVETLHFYINCLILLRLPVKFSTHDETSSLVSASYKMVFFFKIYYFESVLFINTPSLNLIKMLGVKVNCDLSRNPCVVIGICGGCTHIQFMFVNQRTWAVYKTCRRTPI